MPHGRLTRAAGLVIGRQRPDTASGVIFVTLEDETGIANLVVWPRVFERYRGIVMGARLMRVKGTVQREGIVIHVVAERLEDLTDRLRELAGPLPPSSETPAPALARADEPGRAAERRNYPSRDFH
jgi:error-prone DNA polymerase